MIPAGHAPAGHTPGPWQVNAFGGDWRVIARMQPHEVAVSATAAGGDEISNARLIAAAPDLLEALRAVVRSVKSMGVSEDDPGLRKARAALSRATGSQP